jgi:aminoglycoside phosphotransferase (APT) family kinase protein
VLEWLRGRLPVPEVYATLPGELTMPFLPGEHGQDLIERGHARPVLRACGQLLRALHAIPVAGLKLPGPAGRVLAHGDFGPNNTLLDPATFTVTALVDWEFAHLGDPVEDLAWCEWIVRAHHPVHREALEDFFAGYGGPIPAWPQRQAAIVTRCEQLVQFCWRWEPNGPGVALWAERAAIAARWSP